MNFSINPGDCSTPSVELEPGTNTNPAWKGGSVRLADVESAKAADLDIFSNGRDLFFDQFFNGF